MSYNENNIIKELTDREKMLKVITGETDKDILSIYLNFAKDIIIQYAFPFKHKKNIENELIDKYSAVQVEIAAYIYNKQGAEGETVHIENGISRYYETGSIPPSILRRIVPYAGVFDDEIIKEES